MPEATVKRTLVKSPPELWAEISDADSLARHLGEFGEIRITRADPETTVAWEGDRARGTVEIEGSGWGTKVTLTAEPLAVAEPAAAAEPVVTEPAAMAEPVVTEPAAVAEPVAAEPAAMAEPVVTEPVAVQPPAPPAPTVRSSLPEQGEVHVRREEEAPATAPAPAPAAKKPGFWARLFGRKQAVAKVPAPTPEPQATDPEPVQAPVVPLKPAQPEPAQPEPAPVEPAPAAAASEPVEPTPEPQAAATEPAPEPERAPALDAARTEEILNGVLDDLGAAHHRPFSR